MSKELRGEVCVFCNKPTDDIPQAAKDELIKYNTSNFKRKGMDHVFCCKACRDKYTKFSIG